MTKEPGLGRKAVLSRCIVLLGKERRLGDAPLCRGSSVPVLSSWRQLPANAERDFFSAARTYPEETIAFLRCQLSSRSNAYRVAALGLLRELARSDGQCLGREAGVGAGGLRAGRGWKWCTCTRKELQRAGPQLS